MTRSEGALEELGTALWTPNKSHVNDDLRTRLVELDIRSYMNKGSHSRPLTFPLIRRL
jgi:hypothetical protein